MTRNTIAAAGLACILAFGTCACSFSSESTTTVETSTTSEDGTTTTTTETTTTSSNESGEETTSTETTTRINMDEWTDVWLGTTDKGFDIYYAQSPSGDQAFLVLHSESEDVTEYFIGETTNPQEDMVTVDGQDSTFTFQILESDESLDNLVVSYGEDYGTAELTRSDLAELADGVHAFDPDGVILAV